MSRLTVAFLVLIAMFVAYSSDQAHAVLIDDFTDASSDANPGPGPAFTGSLTPGTMIGGVRESVLHHLSGALGNTLVTTIGTGIPDPVMALSNDSGVLGAFDLIYDGGGGGLGGVDLTDGGADNALDIAVNFADFPGDVIVTLIDSFAVGISAGPFPLPGGLPGGAPVGIPIPFAAFPGVDPTSIEVITFDFGFPVHASDIEVLFLDTTLIVPEPATIGLAALAAVVLLVSRRRRM